MRYKLVLLPKTTSGNKFAIKLIVLVVSNLKIYLIIWEGKVTRLVVSL